jgi:hypothetical protein
VAASTGLGGVRIGGVAAGDRGVNVDDHPRLAGYLRHHLPYYEMLRAHRLAVLACRRAAATRRLPAWNYGAVAWELRIELFVAN